MALAAQCPFPHPLNIPFPLALNPAEGQMFQWMQAVLPPVPKAHTLPYRGILIPEEVFPSGFGKQLPGAVEVVWRHKLKQAVLPGRREGKGSRAQASNQ